MTLRRRILLSVAVILSLVAAQLADLRADEDKKSAETSAADEKQQSRFMRVTRDKDDNPLAMQTAIKRYVSADGSNPGLEVELVGAVHIADAAYFRDLNKDFEKYDALLFELVAPEGSVPRKGQKAKGIVSGVQNFMKDLLALEFQLDQIDYERPNFVHADMTPTEFSKVMEDRGESPIGIFLRLMQVSAAAQAERKREPPAMSDLLAVMFDKERGPGILKRIIADELGEADVMLEALNGEEGSLLISERNKVALRVLREQIDAGKKKIGIFYGSGHMIDMEKRLIKDFNLKLAETRWVTAWDLKDKPVKKLTPTKPEKKSGKTIDKKESAGKKDVPVDAPKP